MTQTIQKFSDSFPRIRPCGDAALTVEFGETVDEALNNAVLALNAELNRQPPDGVIEAIPTYRSLFVAYDPVVTSHDVLSRWFLDKVSQPLLPPVADKIWKFPVCYGGDFGVDLGFVAEQTGKTEEEVVRLHTSCEYRIYMMGFIPGFTYLGGLDPAISVPRRDDPRLTSPAGTISIGGVQTGIQCLASPTGWHLIGRTPARTYDPARRQVFFLDPGNKVQFYVVSAHDFMSMERRAEAGELVAEQVQS